MKTQLIFPSYEIIYQHMNTISSQEKNPLITTESNLADCVAKAFADKTLSEEKAKTQMHKAVSRSQITTFTPCLGVVIDLTLFVFLLKCPDIQETSLGSDTCGSTQKKSFSLSALLNRK